MRRAQCSHVRESEIDGLDVLISNETADGDTSPTHSAHHAAGQRLSAGAAGRVAIGVDHGDGLGAGADERVLATAAHGRVERRACSHVDVDVCNVDVRATEELSVGDSAAGSGVDDVEEVVSAVVGVVEIGRRQR